jgi:phosphatidylglycerophosphate synthase
MIRKCICSVKEKGDIEESGLGLALDIVIDTIVVGIVWIGFGKLWVAALVATLLLVIFGRYIYYRSKSHSAPCAWRRALLVVLSVGQYVTF